MPEGNGVRSVCLFFYLYTGGGVFPNEKFEQVHMWSPGDPVTQTSQSPSPVQTFSLFTLTVQASPLDLFELV